MIFGDLTAFKIQQYTGGAWTDITLTTQRKLYSVSLGVVPTKSAQNGGDNKVIDTGGFFPSFGIRLIANTTAETTILVNFINTLNTYRATNGFYRLYPTGSGTYYEVNYFSMPQDTDEDNYAIIEVVFKSRNKVTSF